MKNGSDQLPSGDGINPLQFPENMKISITGKMKALDGKFEKPKESTGENGSTVDISTFSEETVDQGPGKRPRNDSPEIESLPGIPPIPALNLFKLLEGPKDPPVSKNFRWISSRGGFSEF